jgi:hypothetical protein
MFDGSQSLAGMGDERPEVAPPSLVGHSKYKVQI